MENVKKRRGERKMRLQDKLVPYLEYCTYRKELDQKTVKRKIASVKAYYSYLEENELIKESPFRKIYVWLSAAGIGDGL